MAIVTLQPLLFARGSWLKVVVVVQFYALPPGDMPFAAALLLPAA